MLKTALTDEQRRDLVKALRWSLYLSRRVPGSGPVRKWYERKLEGLLAYGLADRTRMSRQSVKFMRMHFDQGLSVRQIAVQCRLSPRRVQQEISIMLYYIVDNAPLPVLADLKPDAFEVRTGQCPRCGGDLFWDCLGAHGRGGEWYCILCARRYDEWLQAVVPA